MYKRQVIVFDVADDGRIETGNFGKGWMRFETMFEAENYLVSVPGVTEKTIIIVGDLGVWADGLYLPCDPLLYFCNSEQRCEFAALTMNLEKWLALYIPLIQRILAESIKNSNMQLPGFDDPALQDLIQNYNSMSIEQLVERYKDEKWFKGKDGWK